MKKQIVASIVMAALASSTIMAQTLITVNGQKIDSKEIDAAINGLKQQNSVAIQDSPELRDQILRNMVVNTLLSQEAKKDKLDTTKEVKNRLSEARVQAKKDGADKKATFKIDWEHFQQSVLADAYIAKYLQAHPVSQQDIETSYKKLESIYKGTQEVLLGQIITQKKEDANKALAELKKNKSFQDVAKQYSIDPNAKQTGGMLPSYVPLKELEATMPPSIYSAIATLKKGSYTQNAIEDKGVFLLLYVDDKRDLKFPTLTELRPSLTQQLQSQQVMKMVDELYKKAKIVQ